MSVFLGLCSLVEADSRELEQKRDCDDERVSGGAPSVPWRRTVLGAQVRNDLVETRDVGCESPHRNALCGTGRLLVCDGQNQSARTIAKEDKEAHRWGPSECWRRIEASLKVRPSAACRARREESALY